MPYTIPSYITENDLTTTNAHVVLRRLTCTAVYAVYKNPAAVAAGKVLGYIEVDLTKNLGAGTFTAQANTALLLMPAMAGAILV